jgi:hypothetical protein
MSLWMPSCFKGKASVAHDTEASPAETDPTKRKTALGTQV